MAHKKKKEGLGGTLGNIGRAALEVPKSIWRGAGKLAAPIAKAITGEKEVRGEERIFGGDVDVKGGVGGLIRDPDVQSFGLTAATLGAGGLITRLIRGGAGGARVFTEAQRIGSLTGKGLRLPPASFDAAQKTLSTITPSRLGSILSRSARKKLIGIGGTIAGVDVLLSWHAADNILTGTSFTLNNVIQAVNSGVIGRDEALAAVNEVEDWANRSERFVRMSVRLNPLLWIGGKNLLIGARKAQFDIALKKAMILSGAVEGQRGQTPAEIETNERLRLQAAAFNAPRGKQPSENVSVVRKEKA